MMNRQGRLSINSETETMNTEETDNSLKEARLLLDLATKENKELKARADAGYRLAFWLNERPTIYLGAIGRAMVKEVLEHE